MPNPQTKDYRIGQVDPMEGIDARGPGWFVYWGDSSFYNMIFASQVDVPPKPGDSITITSPPGVAAKINGRGVRPAPAPPR